VFLKKINDIKLFGDKIAVERSLNLSISDVEGQIAQLGYSGAGLTKDFRVENAKIPPFIQVFYYLVFKNLEIPSEDLLFNTYVEWVGGVKNDIMRIGNLELNLEGVRNRMLRTYPSLIRDFHFYIMLNKSQLFESVEYSLFTDYSNGIDLTLSYNKQVYALAIAIETKRASEYLLVKEDRHDYGNVNKLVLSVPFDELSKVGQIYLLTELHVKSIINQIKNN